MSLFPPSSKEVQTIYWTRYNVMKGSNTSESTVLTGSNMNMMTEPRSHYSFLLIGKGEGKEGWKDW